MRVRNQGGDGEGRASGDGFGKGLAEKKIVGFPPIQEIRTAKTNKNKKSQNFSTIIQKETTDCF